MTLYTESSDGLVTLAAVSIVTGWSEPVPGWELHPLKSSAFHGALFRQPSAYGAHSLCGIWANSKSFLLARSRRADRVGQQATQRTASSGISGRIPISSEELL